MQTPTISQWYRLGYKATTCNWINNWQNYVYLTPLPPVSYNNLFPGWATGNPLPGCSTSTMHLLWNTQSYFLSNDESAVVIF